MSVVLKRLVLQTSVLSDLYQDRSVVNLSSFIGTIMSGLAGAEEGAGWTLLLLVEGSCLRTGVWG